MRGKGIRYAAAVLAGTICLSIGGLTATAAPKENPVVSYGLNVLAGQMDMAVSVPIGNDVVFSEDMFARALNLSKVSYVTVMSLPAVTEGELLLGSSRIAVGQTISAENLPYVSFCAATEDVTHASFGFCANGNPTVMRCNLYMLQQTNYTPTVSMASGLSLNVSTYKDMTAHGTLSAYDPDGDRLTFEIVTYPKNGSVQLTDREAGSYVYTPEQGYVGSDSFTYVARDKYGNYSAAATVQLRITLSGTAITYADMQDSPAHTAALRLTEAGIMSGKQIGNQHYFSPEEGVSRLEFLVMAMHAVGITDVPERAKTVFADDADIEESMKGYVAVAYEMGYVSGSLENGVLRFLPDEQITRAQAAVILNNIIGLSDAPVTPTFADRTDIPVWAVDAIYSLNAAGIFSPEQGYLAPTAKLTRAQTAKMLAAVMAYLD